MRIAKFFLTGALALGATATHAAVNTYVIEFDRVLGANGTATATAVIDDSLFVNDGEAQRLSYDNAGSLDPFIALQLEITGTGLIDGTYTLENLTVSLHFDAPLDPTRELLAQDTALGPGPDFGLNFSDGNQIQNMDVNAFGTEVRDPFDGALLDRVVFRLASMTPVAAIDADGDSVFDVADNCLGVANAGQLDADGDGYGNACDADFNNDCAVNGQDLGILRSHYFSTNPVTDLNGDGITDILDLGLFRSRFFAAPGPSGTTGVCN